MVSGPVEIVARDSGEANCDRDGPNIALKAGNNEVWAEDDRGTFPWPRHLHPSADPALLLDQLKLPVFDLPPTVAPLVGPEQAAFRQQERADKSAWTCRIGLPHGEGHGTVAGG